MERLRSIVPAKARPSECRIGRFLENCMIFWRKNLLIFSGDVNATILDILGGIRSACTYIGATRLKEMSKRATFIRVNRQTNDVYNHLEI